MKVNNKAFQSIWYETDTDKIWVIDQRKLPFSFETIELNTLEQCFWAIKEMVVRGAPLIGVTAAYGLYIAIKTNPNKTSKEFIVDSADYLKSSRPTAVNLEYVVDAISQKLVENIETSKLCDLALEFAIEREKQEIKNCSNIGHFGLSLIEDIYFKNGKQTVNILTHCNAGWLACVDWGTALSPIYKAQQKGIPVHVWVDETRPRNQGARLTAWELQSADIPYTVIADNTGGHLMQHSLVDMVIVGSDRTTLNGDVANKIGTYLKALAAFDNNIPFYVALPSSTIDFNMTDGIKNIPIEERHGDEVLQMECFVDGIVKNAHLMPESTTVANYGFDVTPARLVTALITERGICKANEKDILILFPEYQ
ncbi:MAG: S-methyl-5-thioribose-1-phosphate isomerase [Salinivirgaceae bacterium]|jgi:methylthioribose-1-phosphate isomerase|nr:S-methyl-5-thioribose-1-phosphate isomerase [Salinivirgaceae bacterium]